MGYADLWAKQNYCDTIEYGSLWQREQSVELVAVVGLVVRIKETSWWSLQDLRDTQDLRRGASTSAPDLPAESEQQETMVASEDQWLSGEIRLSTLPETRVDLPSPLESGQVVS
jgi:hypothetical protein